MLTSTARPGGDAGTAQDAVEDAKEGPVSGGRQGAPGFDPRRLRDARTAARLTQTALAEAADVPLQQVKEWEAGRRVPQVDNLAALARALQVSPLDLLDRDADRDLTLQELRAAAGLTQQQAASRAGLLRTTYSQIERGETVGVSPADATAIGAALAVAEADVLAAHAASRAAYLARRGTHRTGGRPTADD
jgi:transcriptional regulator with XRE-family HTH domain